MQFLSVGGNIGGNGGNRVGNSVGKTGASVFFDFSTSIFAFLKLGVDSFPEVWYTNGRRKNSTRGEPFSHLTV